MFETAAEVLKGLAKAFDDFEQEREGAGKTAMMNGVEAASLLRHKIPDIQIILFTIYADEVNGPLSSTMGVTVVLPKTDGFIPLLNCLNGLLGSA